MVFRNEASAVAATLETARAILTTSSPCKSGGLSDCATQLRRNILLLWLQVETFAVAPVTQKPILLELLARDMGRAMGQLQPATMGSTSTRSPLFALAHLVLSEMHDVVAPILGAGHAKPSQLVELTSVLRISVLLLMFLGVQHRTPDSAPSLSWQTLTKMALCMGHLLLLSCELSLVTDFACVCSKAAAYVIDDPSLLSQAKLVLCQAQLEQKRLMDEDEDWADFTPHDRSQRLFSLEWTPTNKPKQMAENDDEEEEDWDKELAQDEGQSGATSSLSTVLNMRDLFIDASSTLPPSEASRPRWLTQRIDECPTASPQPPPPPPPSPYSKSFAAFETGQLLSQICPSARSIEAWLTSLDVHPPRFVHDAETEVLALTDLPVYERLWCEGYVHCCNVLQASAPDVCLGLATAFFQMLATTRVPTTLCKGVVAAGKHILATLALVLHPLGLSATVLDAPVAQLKALGTAPDDVAMLELECALHLALCTCAEDFADSVDQLALLDRAHTLLQRAHASLVAEREILCHGCPASIAAMERSMTLHLLVHCVAFGLSPLTLQHVTKGASLDVANDLVEAETAALSTSPNIFAHVLKHTAHPSQSAVYARLVHLFGYLPLQSSVRIQAGMVLGTTMLALQCLQDAENVLYESVYLSVSAKTTRIRSPSVPYMLCAFGDALVSNRKYRFGIVAYEAALRAGDAAFCTDLERKLAILCSDNGDIDRSLVLYARIRHTSRDQRRIFEYVYVAVTMATMHMERGAFASAASDMQHVLTFMKNEVFTQDVRMELHVLRVRLAICLLHLQEPQNAIVMLLRCRDELLQSSSHVCASSVKLVVVLGWLATAYLRDGALAACDETLLSIARLRETTSCRYNCLASAARRKHVSHGSFAKVPSCLNMTVSLHEHPGADLYSLQMQLSLARCELEKAAHYSALAIITLELDPHAEMHELAALYYLRGKALDACLHHPGLFPMKLQGLECEQLILANKPKLSHHRRKSSTLLRERVLVTSDECLYHAVRSLHHSFELYKSTGDKPGMVRAANRLAAMYFDKVFVSVLVRNQSLVDVAVLRLKRRHASSHLNLNDECVEFAFTLDDMRGPATLGFDLSLDAMAPEPYMEACVNMATLCALRNDWPEMLRYWYEARDVFYHCGFGTGKRHRRFRHRLVQLLLCCEPALVAANSVLLDVAASDDVPLWFWRKTQHKNATLPAETSLSYHYKRLRETRPSHQRTQSESLEHVPPTVHGKRSGYHRSFPPRIRDKGRAKPRGLKDIFEHATEAPNGGAEEPPLVTRQRLLLRVAHSAGRGAEGSDHSVQQDRLRKVWALAEEMRGGGLSQWCASLVLDAVPAIYVLGDHDGIATFSTATVSGDWRILEGDTLTRYAPVLRHGSLLAQRQCFEQEASTTSIALWHRLTSDAPPSLRERHEWLCSHQLDAAKEDDLRGPSLVHSKAPVPSSKKVSTQTKLIVAPVLASLPWEVLLEEAPTDPTRLAVARLIRPLEAQPQSLEWSTSHLLLFVVHPSTQSLLDVPRKIHVLASRDAANVTIDMAVANVRRKKKPSLALTSCPMNIAVAAMDDWSTSAVTALRRSPTLFALLLVPASFVRPLALALWARRPKKRRLFGTPSRTVEAPREWLDDVVGAFERTTFIPVSVVITGA
ncbi:hypothetical protein, variant [Saprolegnia diclina VS20]|nr:hypothetical protein, variant [Saprolegnia diclina VS20]EQC40121.1 hypothetical protein, variant [Saprolegnia diclina VS20]|eukprot:XP_008606595.1 hypothetical protein, variant [Saprolegnia diclina VS20]